MNRRVVVTGVGLVCGCGIGTEEVWRNLLAGKSGIRTITHFDATAFDCRIAGEVRDFDPLNWLEKKELKKTGRFIQLALAAADFAMQMSGLQVTPEIRISTGVYIGSGIGGFDVIEREHSKFLAGGPGKISPFFIPATIVNLAAGHVSIRHGAKGPNSATATACSASAHAIGDAFKIIQRGAADVMITGGTEAAITPMSVGGFAAMRALSTRNDDPEHASRPFDADRDGFIVGEGSGMVILESLEYAQRRGAKILAEIVGYGMSGDAYHITQPAEHGDGGYRVSMAALKDAKHFCRRRRLRQRARNFHADRRRHRNRSAQARFRRARQKSSHQLDQIDDRPSARRRRRPGSRNQRARSARPDSCRPRSITKSPIPYATSITFPIVRAKRKSTTRSRIPSASAAPTPP